MSGHWAAGGQAARHFDPRFAAAHRALAGDPDVQFQLVLPSPPAGTPAWLSAIGQWIARILRPVARGIAWIGSRFPNWPYARILLWSVIALLASLVLWMAVERVRHGEWRRPRLPRRRSRVAARPADEPLFEEAPARAWLREADSLAAIGRFAEAAHLLLFRSVEDLARRRPGAVRPAFTARELAAAPAFPPLVRARFAAIAALVERSLFGGRAVDGDDWQAARAAYAELALPQAWRPS